MIVAWWSGKGYQSLLILVLALIVFALGAQSGVVGKVDDGSWAWGVPFFFAAAINWWVGSNANAKRLATRKVRTWRTRLWYRARHRIFSMPMETFSLVMAAVGIGIIIYRLGRTLETPPPLP